MKTQIIYSSLSGQTKKLAEGIFNSLECEEKEIYDLKDGEPTLDADVILLGYWVDKGGPNKEMIAFMEKIKDKTVGVFCTLAYYVDSMHGVNSLQKGIELLKDNNTILGSYVCNGAISQAMLNMFKKMPSDHYHGMTKESEIRWEVLKNHPTTADIALACERFNERIELYRLFKKNGIEYKSIT